MTNKEELVIISGIGIGLYDTDRPCLWFNVSTLSGESLIVLGWERASEFIIKAGYVVSRKDNSYSFVRLCKFI